MDRKSQIELKAWALINAVLTPGQQVAAEQVTNRWLLWLQDPERYPPPNPRAAKSRQGPQTPEDAATAMRERATKVLAKIKRERERDPEPNRQWDPTEHMAWALRESDRQSRWAKWAEYLA